MLTYVFNVCVASHTWISPSLRGDGPEAREGHSAALVGKRLFIFGGCGKSSNNSDEVYYNDLYILNTGEFQYKVSLLITLVKIGLNDFYGTFVCKQLSCIYVDYSHGYYEFTYLIPLA